jgi:hypothetical protein
VWCKADHYCQTGEINLNQTERNRDWLSKKFNELRSNFGGICHYPECKSIENLQFAHRRPTRLSGSGRGKRKRYYDIMNNPVNYILLCLVHHARYDGRKSKEYE